LGCGKTFSLKKIAKASSHFRLFKIWVSEGVTVKVVNNTSQTKRTLIDSFRGFLAELPLIKPLSTPKEIDLKCDGKYFGRYGCSLVFKEGGSVIYWSWVERETYRDYLYCFFRLKELGYIVKSVTSDKHGSVIGAVKTAFPDVPHQYCLVHIQRRCQTLLTKRPDTKEGQALLRLVKVINIIKSKNDEIVFRKWLENYENDNIAFLSQKTYGRKLDGGRTWWYTHRDVRMAFRHIKTSLEHMFLYLEDPNISKDTNGLEAEFTHLKTKLNMHRGLSRERRSDFVYWYWFLKSTYNNSG